MAAAPVKVFCDRMSQPSRSVLLLCKAAGIPHEEVRVNLGRNEQRSPAFLAVNQLGRVPALQDGDFCLAESSAILRYLCETRRPANHWWPSDPQARARVGSAMDWHGSALRVGSMLTVWNRAIVLNLRLPGNEQLVQDYALPTLKAALKALDGVWLAEGRFVAGQGQPSIADLLLACEVEQLCLLDGAAQGPTMAELLAPHPKVSAWLQRVREACCPQWDEVHTILHKSRDRLVARKQQQASKL